MKLKWANCTAFDAATFISCHWPRAYPDHLSVKQSTCISKTQHSDSNWLFPSLIKTAVLGERVGPSSLSSCFWIVEGCTEFLLIEECFSFLFSCTEWKLIMVTCWSALLPYSLKVPGLNSGWELSV